MDSIVAKRSSSRASSSASSKNKSSAKTADIDSKSSTKWDDSEDMILLNTYINKGKEVVMLKDLYQIAADDLDNANYYRSTRSISDRLQLIFKHYKLHLEQNSASTKALRGTLDDNEWEDRLKILQKVSDIRTRIMEGNDKKSSTLSVINTDVKQDLKLHSLILTDDAMADTTTKSKTNTKSTTKTKSAAKSTTKTDIKIDEQSDKACEDSDELAITPVSIRKEKKNSERIMAEKVSTLNTSAPSAPVMKSANLSGISALVNNTFSPVSTSLTSAPVITSPTKKSSSKKEKKEKKNEEKIVKMEDDIIEMKEDIQTAPPTPTEEAITTTIKIKTPKKSKKSVVNAPVDVSTVDMSTADVSTIDISTVDDIYTQAEPTNVEKTKLRKSRTSTAKKSSETIPENIPEAIPEEDLTPQKRPAISTFDFDSIPANVDIKSVQQVIDGKPPTDAFTLEVWKHIQLVKLESERMIKEAEYKRRELEIQAEQTTREHTAKTILLSDLLAKLLDANMDLPTFDSIVSTVLQKHDTKKLKTQQKHDDEIVIMKKK